jgi:hypothetical protein
MHILVGILSAALIALMFAEFFVTFLLPRRVKRDPRIARQFFSAIWRPWRWLAARLSNPGADTMLGLFGPIGLLFILGFLAGGVIVGFAGLHWAERSTLGGSDPAAFGEDLYFSAGSFFTASTTTTPVGGIAKLLQIAEAASGFAVLFISIGYLPALFQAFSRRETAISQLDPRAGSPPTAGALLERSSESDWAEIDSYLREWETWAAEVMETQLSYPVIGWFRSQHVNQNWVAALTTVVDASAFSIAYAPGRSVGAEVTFAIGRHALVDLARSYRAPIEAESIDRLSDADLEELITRLRSRGLELNSDDDAKQMLSKMRSSYEKYAIAIAERLALALPGWLPGEDAVEYWRVAGGHRHGDHRRDQFMT